MNDIVQNHTSPSTAGALAVFGLTAVMAAGQPAWLLPETRTYEVPEIRASYSPFIEQALTLAPTAATTDFAQEITEVFAALSEGQEPLGGEFEAVWDQNVESLYES